LRSPISTEEAGHGGTHLPSQLHRKAQLAGSWSRPAQAKSKAYLQNNQNKKDWRRGSICRHAAGTKPRVQTPEPLKKNIYIYIFLYIYS
jgi:hypothetical protein